LNFDDFPFFSSSIGHLEPDLEQFENRLIFDGLPKFPAATWMTSLLENFFFRFDSVAGAAPSLSMVEQ